jgi:hypothetical protein
MKNSLLALALAAATMPLTFAGQSAPQTPSANPPAATSKTHKTKKAKVKKSHVKKNKTNGTGSTSGSSK